MMRAIKAVMVLTMALSAGQAMGADNPDPAHSALMPAVDISNQPLEKVLDQIRTKLPWFHYVVFRSPTAPADYPKLPVMSIEGITLEQFIDLIKDQYPSVKVSIIPGEKTSLYSIRIEDPAASHLSPFSSNEEAQSVVKIEYARHSIESRESDLKRIRQLFEAGGASQTEVEQADEALRLAQAQLKLAMLEHEQAVAEAARAQAGQAPGGKGPADKPIVKVYRLDDMIKGGDTKTAMNDVLTLIQATFDAAGGDAKDKPVLSVHAQTQTLIFKGSPEKMQLLEQVLESLRPKSSDEVKKLREQLADSNQMNDRLREALEQTRSEAATFRSERRDIENQLLATKAEVGMMQGRLDQQSSATKPSK